MTYRTRLCAALLLLVPSLAAAQDPVPSPPKPEIVIIRSAGGTIEVKGITSADLFEFTQQCESREGISASTVSLTLPLEIEGGPNGSLEQTTALLREAVAKGYLMTVEGSGDAESRPSRVMIIWSGGLPAFEGVVESVGMKYTMFLPSGTPVRATVSVKFKEANRLSFKKGEARESNKSDTKKSDCSPKQ
jgi:Contractile injection system tube protein